MEHCALTVLQSSMALGVVLGLVTLATGRASGARTCAEATIVLSSVPFDGVGSGTVSGGVAMRVVSEDAASVLDCGSPLPPGAGGALDARPGELLPP